MQLRARPTIPLLALLASLAAGPVLARAPADLPARVGGVLKAHGGALSTGARVQVSVRRLADGKEIFVAGDGDLMNLASVTKILTAAAALEHLGPDRRFRTRVRATGRKGHRVGALYLVGGGDPVLSEADLAALALAVRREGVERVTRLLVAPTPFGPARFPPGYTKKRTQSGYRAPVGGLNLDRNRVRVKIWPGAKRGDPIRVRLYPSAGFAVESTGRTAKGRADRLSLSIAWSKPKGSKAGAGHRLPTVHISGTLGLRRRGGVTAVRLDRRPEVWAGETFRVLLGRAGVKVPEDFDLVEAPPEKAALVASHASEPLAGIVRTMLHRSDNQIAETLLLHLSEDPARGFEGGLWRIRDWSELAGVPAGRVKLHNASGLYDGGFADASAVTSLLREAWRRPAIAPELLAALAVPGRPGTLERRLGDLPAGAVRAKTGTLNETSALCGYAFAAEPLAFCVLVDDLQVGYLRRARTLQDAAVRALFEPAPPSTETPR